jgi:hypothetical protein
VFSKIGFRIAREGKHAVMSNGKVRLTIPRHNPIKFSRWRRWPKTRG